MFDMLIPSYWDHDRDPEGYYPFVNGMTKEDLDGFGKWWSHKHCGLPQGTNVFHSDSFRQRPFNLIPHKHTFRPFREGEPFLYPVFHHYSFMRAMEPYHEVDFDEGKIRFYRTWFRLHPDLLARIARKQGKIFIYNGWEAYDISHWSRVIDDIRGKYPQLDRRDFIVGNQNLVCDRVMPAVSWVSFQEVGLAECNNTPAGEACPVHDDAACAAHDRNYGLDDMKQLIAGKHIRPHAFVCLNRRLQPHRYHALVRLWPDRGKGLLSFLCMVPAIDPDAASGAKVDGDYAIGHTNQVRMQLADPSSQISRDIRFFLDSCPTPDIVRDWFGYDIQNNLPVLIDDGVDGRINPAYDLNADKFMNSYLNIVCETRAGTFGGKLEEVFLSEKTFKPIRYMQPFVLLAYPTSLQHLRRLGYETFGRWIDESYDTIMDDGDRYDAALSSAKKFYDRPAGELSDIMLDMLPVLEHNYMTLRRNVDNLQVDVVTKLMWNMADISRRNRHAL